jgi:hypothetical protein
MSIFINPAVLTPAQIAARRIRQISKKQYTALGKAGIAGHNLIWNNHNASPQEVLAALGTAAVAAFQLAALNQSTVVSAAAIAGVTPPTIPSVPTGWTVTPNSDGTVSVTPPASTPAKK